MDYVTGSLADVLKSARSKSKMSLRDYAGYLGISHAYLNKLEKGLDPRTGKIISPTVDLLIKLAERLGIPTAKFFDMCGYTKKSTCLAECSLIDRISLDEEVEELLTKISLAKDVMINESKVSQEDVDDLVTTLKKKTGSLIIKHR